LLFKVQFITIVAVDVVAGRCNLLLCIVNNLIGSAGHLPDIEM